MDPARSSQHLTKGEFTGTNGETLRGPAEKRIEDREGDQFMATDSRTVFREIRTLFHLGAVGRLSDSRGKVVVLTVAGRLCGDRRDIYAQDRALVQRMNGRPFALVNVNLDEEEAAYRKSIESGEMTWRCWWEGGFDGPNRRRWQSSFVPSVYVIDADGIIRAKDLTGTALDGAFNPLVHEIEAKNATSR